MVLGTFSRTLLSGDSSLSMEALEAFNDIRIKESIAKHKIERPGESFSVAVYPGTFGPVTSDHETIARSIANRIDIGALIIIPTGGITNTTKQPDFTPQERLYITAKKVQDCSKIIVSPLEVNLKERCYTADTLEKVSKLFQEIYGIEVTLSIVTGEDVYASLCPLPKDSNGTVLFDKEAIPKWKNAVDLVKKYQWLVIRRETPGEDRSQLDLDIASTDAFFKKQGVAPPNPITNIPLKGTSSTERRKEFANVTTIVHEISNSPEEKPGFSSKYKLLQEKLESSNNITTGLDLSKELREGVFPAEAYVDNILDPKISVQIDSLSCLSNIVLPILLRPLKERNEPLQKVILYGDAVDSEKAEFVAQKYLEFGFQVTRLSNTITAKDAIERLES